MIKFKTFQSGEDATDFFKTRKQAAKFANDDNIKRVISVSECRTNYSIAVTVWYEAEGKSDE